MIVRAALLGFAFLGVMGAAAAPRAVEGVWSFKTQAFDNGCVISGQLIVKPKGANGAHTCQLEAHEVCPDLKANATQTCTLTESKGQVIIKSKITRASVDAYAPDDFTLKLENASRMSGNLESAGLAVPTLFFRGDPTVS